MAEEFGVMEEVKHDVTPEVCEAARKNPGGWVYKIEGNFGPDEAVPPEAVVGAWKVDDFGNLTGEFISNPNYKPGASPATPSKTGSGDHT
jgi:hypothetical protein